MMGTPELDGFGQALEIGFGQMRERFGGDVAVLRARLDAAEAQRSAADAVIAELRARFAEIERIDVALQAQHDAIARGAVAAFRCDAGELVLVQHNGTELRATVPQTDPAAVAVLVVERHLDKLRGDKGEPGDKGDPGADAVVDVGELAAVLRSDAGFVASLRGDKGDKGDAGESIKGDKGDRGDVGAPGQPAEPWVARVYRAGSRVSHYIGRTYEAIADTATEPGDSTDWRRLGTDGMRHIGGSEPHEPGDVHTREGATFLFDGARSWLLFAKAFTQGDSERALKPLRGGLRELAGRCDELKTNADDGARALSAVAELARGADAAARANAEWINEHAEAIEAALLLLAKRPRAA